MLYPAGRDRRAAWRRGDCTCSRPGPADWVWAVSECLRCSRLAAVIAPMPARLSRPQVRRLQLAAEQGGTLGVFLRPDAPGADIYAAATRWFVAPRPGRPRPTSLARTAGARAWGTDRMDESHLRRGASPCRKRYFVRTPRHPRPALSALLVMSAMSESWVSLFLPHWGITRVMRRRCASRRSPSAASRPPSGGGLLESANALIVVRRTHRRNGRLRRLRERRRRGIVDRDDPCRSEGALPGGVGRRRRRRRGPAGTRSARPMADTLHPRRIGRLAGRRFTRK